MKLPKSLGIIKECKKYIPQCQHKCCTFHNNYIVLYPGEWEKSKLRKDHLTIIDNDYFGGKKVQCRKGNHTLSLRPCNPEIEFKPLDCRSYPYFPQINSKGKIKIIKGKKCPLTDKDLAKHRKLFLKTWNSLIKDKTIFEWLKRVKLVGYEPEKFKNK